MQDTTQAIFQSTIQTTDEWLRRIDTELGWRNRHRAYTALRATLHALRDRLPLDESAQFSSQLPLLIRGIYFEGWDPQPKPDKLSKADLMDAIHEAFGHDPDVNPERVAEAVFATIAAHVSRGEVDDVRAALPKALAELWPRAAGVGARG